MTTTTTNPVIQRIQQDIRDNDVVLYMKGTPVFPQCGFSAAVIQVLSELGVKFKSFDVLTDPEPAPGHQGIQPVADDPPALRQGRVHRRLRHRARDVCLGRARAALPNPRRAARRRRSIFPCFDESRHREAEAVRV